MYRDTATTREAWAIGGAVVIALIAFASWLFIPTPKVVAIAISALALGGIFRIARPITYEFIVDRDGLHWGKIGKKKKDARWVSIRKIRYDKAEGEVHLDCGEMFLTSVPTYFIRSEEKIQAFLGSVKTLSPTTRIDII